MSVFRLNSTTLKRPNVPKQGVKYINKKILLKVPRFTEILIKKIIIITQRVEITEV